MVAKLARNDRIVLYSHDSQILNLHTTHSLPRYLQLAVVTKSRFASVRWIGIAGTVDLKEATFDWSIVRAHRR